MSLTARHKKAGGFRKLVNSLETTILEKRAKILQAMRAEDPDFVAEVEACIFNFEEFATIDDLIVCELIGGLNKEMRTFALALFHSEELLVQKFFKNMRPPEIRDFREHTTSLRGVLAREQIGARFRIIEKARELESQRKFILKKYSPHYRDE